MAESPIFRPQKKLKITRSPVEVKLPTSSLSPGQVKSICHLHCVWQNGISVLDTRRKGVGREGRRKVRGRPVSAAFLCFPSEGEHGPQQRWGDKWSSLHRCLSVCLAWPSPFTSNLPSSSGPSCASPANSCFCSSVISLSLCLSPSLWHTCTHTSLSQVPQQEALLLPLSHRLQRQSGGEGTRARDTPTFLTDLCPSLDSNSNPSGLANIGWANFFL